MRNPSRTVPTPSNVARRYARHLTGQLNKVLAQAPTMARLDDVALRAIATDSTRDQVEVFAAVVEAADRCMGLRPHPTQILAGLALADGTIAEMATGEGKTLAATLPAVWLANQHRTVHVATANDYLAARDGADMGRLYQYLGLTVGVVVATSTRTQRQGAYRCHIVYGTASQFGFDYLRDHLVYDLADKVQGPLAAAIVDEADALLIDEARTPLVISGQRQHLPKDWARYATVAARFDPEHYELDLADHQVTLTEAGAQFAEQLLGVDDLYADQTVLHHTYAALAAQTLYRAGKDYLVAPDPATGRDAVLIIDEHTGRTLPGRRFQNSIHEAIEAKEGLSPEAQARTETQITLQGFFTLYEHLCGMTGTTGRDGSELNRTYGTPVVKIPTNRPVARIDHPDRIYLTEADKIAGIVADVTDRLAAGQPVLVGTPSVEDSERISAALHAAGLPHQVLNARRPAVEAAVIAQAGRPATLTVATNMAGRGVDIRLGGSPEGLAAQECEIATDEHGNPTVELTAEQQVRYQEALARWRTRCDRDREQVIASGGLYVLGTARHSSRRIDDQLRGRAGRQGEPGLSRFYLSCEDELVAIYGDTTRTLISNLGAAPGEPVDSKALAKMVAKAQARVEADHAEARRQLLAYDEVYNSQRLALYNLRDHVLAASWEENVGRLAQRTFRRLLDPTGSNALTPESAAPALARFATADEIGAAYATGQLDTAVRVLADTAAARFGTCVSGVNDPQVIHHTLTVMSRQVVAGTIDYAWATLLEQLAQLRTGVGLRSVAQQDPKLEFAADAQALFAAVVAESEELGLERLLRVQAHLTPASEHPASAA